MFLKKKTTRDDFIIMFNPLDHLIQPIVHSFVRFVFVCTRASERASEPPSKSC